MKVSVITPSYNQGEFIEETIKSVISQEGDFYLEYLVMDGGSTDETVSIIKKYDALIKEGKWPLKCKGVTLNWVSEKDKGQTDAVNKGFRRATGEILGWVNSDDVYLPGAIAKASGYFLKHKEAVMVYGEGYYIDKAGKVIERFKTEPFDYNRLAELCYICQPSAFLRRTVLDEVGYLDESLHMCMDYDYWMRIGKKYSFHHMTEYFSGARLYSDTKTALKIADSYAEAMKLTKKYYGYVPDGWIYGFIDNSLAKYIKPGSGLRNIFYFSLRKAMFNFLSLKLKASGN